MKFAIIGTDCQLPGDINSMEHLYNVLYNKKLCISDIPTNRWGNVKNTQTCKHM